MNIGKRFRIQAIERMIELGYNDYDIDTELAEKAIQTGKNNIIREAFSRGVYINPMRIIKHRNAYALQFYQIDKPSLAAFAVSVNFTEFVGPPYADIETIMKFHRVNMWRVVNPADYNVIRNGKTIFYSFISIDKLTISEVLEMISKGADINFVTPDGHNSLKYCDKKYLELLIRKGARIPAELTGFRGYEIASLWPVMIPKYIPLVKKHLPTTGPTKEEFYNMARYGIPCARFNGPELAACVDSIPLIPFTYDIDELRYNTVNFMPPFKRREIITLHKIYRINNKLNTIPIEIMLTIYGYL
jgi:hypothetical protein